MKKILLFAAILSALALSTGCNADRDGQDWDGLEYITFDISGTVTDMNGTPLKNIAVVNANADTVRTGNNGYYRLSGMSVPVTSVKVEYVDTDGSENGGRFIKTSMNVEMEFCGGAHGPYMGKYEAKGVDVKVMSDAVITPGSPELQ